MRGCRYGKKFPTRVHSREVSYPFFEKKSTRDDNHVLCGGVVSGPYSTKGATDKYTNDRRKWVESEAALDYSGAVACAFGGYAALSTSDLSSCSSRTAFTGRSSGGAAKRKQPAPKPKRKPAAKPARKPAPKAKRKPAAKPAGRGFTRRRRGRGA